MSVRLSWPQLVRYPWPLRALLLLVCLLLVPMAGYFLHARALIADFEQAKARHEHLQQQWQGLVLGTEVQSVLARVRELDAALEQRRNELFDDDGLASLVQGLGRLGAGLSFEQVRVGEAVAQANYLEVPIHMRVSGRYLALQRFLVELAGREHLVTLRQLSLTMPEPQASGQLNMSLQLQAYRAIASQQVAQARVTEALEPRDPFAAVTSMEASPVVLDQAVLVGHLRGPGGQVAVVRVGEAVYPLREGDRFGAERVAVIDEGRIELVAPGHLGAMPRVLRMGAVVEG